VAFHSVHKYSEEMEISQAVELIATPLIDWTRPQSWCDLGSGTGTFTMALARLLAPGSTIFAMDQDRRALAEIPDHFNRIEIRKTVGDLRKASLHFPLVDGVLIANTLHFIREQQNLVNRLLSVADCFLIVEYEQSLPNPWGPYPVGFSKLGKLFAQAGVERVEQIAVRPSRFGGTMYSALVTGHRSSPRQ
jgi:trans-aconitate methyltransferase